MKKYEKQTSKNCNLVAIYQLHEKSIEFLKLIKIIIFKSRNRFSEELYYDIILLDLLKNTYLNYLNTRS
ncbi:hypothetical protein FDF11_12880 [Clostridium botulinum]|nr:hypothetical protein [Clostridium botulinum]NFR14441.1 hypothetical protein [Clostridium botulinum]NFR45141.1 hypothetical protein [Clostridium botulinum]NFS51539.1 hypothetical protein [Clostridium botulinum]